MTGGALPPGYSRSGRTVWAYPCAQGAPAVLRSLHAWQMGSIYVEVSNR